MRSGEERKEENRSVFVSFAGYISDSCAYQMHIQRHHLARSFGGKRVIKIWHGSTDMEHNCDAQKGKVFEIFSRSWGGYEYI